MSPKIHITATVFRDNIIAQSDDEDYQESGYVAAVINGVAYLASYSHCSCFGTFESLIEGSGYGFFESGDASFDWSGTPDELVALAKFGGDPTFPTRKSIEVDADARHLAAVYAQIIEWDKTGRGKPVALP